jgi:hypothetical protein
MCGHINDASTSSNPCRHLHIQQNLQRAQTCTVARSSWSEGHSCLVTVSSSFYMHCTLRGGGSHEVFPLSSFYFSVSFVFVYLTCPHWRDTFFIFTIVMFRGCVGVLHTHLGFIFPKVLPMFISHYPIY